jgi:hypothetical protein
MEDNQSKYESASIILAKALNFILNDNQGIYLKMQIGSEDSNQIDSVIVFKKNDQINIFKTDHELVDGTLVNMSENNEQIQ